jgi:hypothetical protein
MFPYYKSWIIFGSTFMYEIKFHGYCLFHPEYGWKFIHDHSSIEDSWMISHECSSIKYEYFLLNYFVSSLYLLPDSTLPNGEIHVTIWLFCKIDFSWLSSPLCQVTESTMLNCWVHVAKSTFPSYQFHTTKATLPNC